MNKFLLVTLLLIPFLAIGQKQKGYFGFAPGIYVYKNAEPGLGLHLSGNAQMGAGVYLGGQIGVVKFKGMDGVYIPLQAKLTGIFNKDESKASPMITVEPGYGVYNKSQRVGGTTFTTQGGFTIYSGVGIALPSKGKGWGFFTLGYSAFQFTTNEVSDFVETLGIRAGIMLR
jgi:hypothetical protein